MSDILAVLLLLLVPLRHSKADRGIIIIIIIIIKSFRFKDEDDI